MGILIAVKIIFDKILETSLISEIAKYATYMAGLAILGLSAVHMVRDWAGGKQGAIPRELPEPSEEEEETQ